MLRKRQIPGFESIISPPACCPGRAQKVVKMIGSDKAKIQIYCDIVELGDQIDETNPKDKKKIDELDQRMDDLAAKLGPEYVALVGGLEEMDPNSKDSKEINSTLECELRDRARRLRSFCIAPHVRWRCLNQMCGAPQLRGH